jgi:hypothetical protein
MDWKSNKECLPFMDALKGWSKGPNKGSKPGTTSWWKNPSRVSNEENLLYSFRSKKRGFHDLLTHKPSSLFI